MSADTFYEEPKLLNPLISFDEDRVTNELIVKEEQYIPDDWLAEVAAMKVDSANHKTGDFYHVASIPLVVVDDLMINYGFDVMNAPVRETLAMLKRYALDKFILTNKTI
jgi:hypothetical protein